MFPSDNNFETKVTLESKANLVDDDEPFRILMLGDWSGRQNRNSSTGASNFRAVEIDRDNFDNVINSFDISLNLDLSNDNTGLIHLEICEFDDFHPDNIFRQLPCFSHLRELRRKLLKTETFNSAADEVRSWFSLEHTKNKVGDTEISQNTSPPDSNFNLLDQILNQTSVDNSVPNPPLPVQSELSNLIADLVRPFVIHTDENEQKDLVAVIDRASGDIMREILHHPAFQSLESAWRGLYFLVRRIETSVDLKIFICDIAKDQLATDLKSNDNLADTSFFKFLADENYESIGINNWSVFGGNYNFQPNVDDVAMLMRLAQISKITNSPFISSVSQNVFEGSPQNENDNKFEISTVSDEYKLWQMLRSIPESSYLGMTFARFLARLPFGDKTDPLENFSFEEFSDIPNSNYTWIDPVFACILLLAQSFQFNGWQMGMHLQRQIDDLPIHIFKAENLQQKRVLSVNLNQNSCLNLLELGIMPLIAFQDSDAVRLARFQSISEPFSLLKGKWNDG